MKVYTPHHGMTEEQYLEECRKRFRASQDDTQFVVSLRMSQIAKQCHPNDKQAEYQFRNALSRLIRTKFNIRTMHFLHCADKDDVLKFLDSVEKLME